jgi:membrane protein
MSQWLARLKTRTAAANEPAVSPTPVAPHSEPAAPVASSTAAPDIAVSVAYLDPHGGWLDHIAALARYLVRTDVHTYAFSVAANAILSLFPFMLVLLTISRRVFHSSSMQTTVVEFFRFFLPVGQDFVMRNMLLLARTNHGTIVFSIIMLMITTTGIFLPLEVALNQVWQAPRNRSYIGNQIVSLALAFFIGVIALVCVALTSRHAGADGASNYILVPVAFFVSILFFFLIYWILPNRRVPPLAVLPAAIITGLVWQGMKYVFIVALPWIDFQRAYGPFSISVSLMTWAFISGLILLAGAHFSASMHTSRQARLNKFAAPSHDAPPSIAPSR